MDLVENEITAKKELSSVGIFEVLAEKKLELAHWNPGKIQDLDLTVPVGKKWAVKIDILIQETDA